MARSRILTEEHKKKIGDALRGRKYNIVKRVKDILVKEELGRIELIPQKGTTNG